MSGETNNLAPKEQPPRKLSGKMDRQSITLWKVKFSAEGVKLSGTNTDGDIKVICKKNI